MRLTEKFSYMGCTHDFARSKVGLKMICVCVCAFVRACVRACALVSERVLLYKFFKMFVVCTADFTH